MLLLTLIVKAHREMLCWMKLERVLTLCCRKRLWELHQSEGSLTYAPRLSYPCLRTYLKTCCDNAQCDATNVTCSKLCRRLYAHANSSFKVHRTC